jgi:hypothetical protein
VEREEVVGDWWDEVMQPPTSGDRKGCYGLSRAQTQRRGDSEDEDPPPARSMLRSGGRSREAAIPLGDPRRRRREPRCAYSVSCVCHDHDKLPKHAAPVEHGPKKNPGHWMYSSTPSLQMSSKHALGTGKYVVTIWGSGLRHRSTRHRQRHGVVLILTRCTFVGFIFMVITWFLLHNTTRCTSWSVDSSYKDIIGFI